MAQEYKRYDRMYKPLMGTALKTIEKVKGKIPKEHINEFDCWDPAVWGPYETYSQEKVNWAVYNAEGFEEWQKFRVSLKGHSTKEKLFCLASYYANHLGKSDREEDLMKIRVNNYLGALIRGGLLNSNLVVIR